MNAKALGTLAALSLAALSGTTNAGVTYTWWVNGVGYAQLDYTLTCADGTTITRTVRDFSPSGSDACADGSNSITWEFGWWWHRDIRAVDRKRAMSTARVSGMAERAPAALFDSSHVDLPSNHWSGEYAVVRVDPARLPEFPDGPVSVTAMLDRGILEPSQLLFLQPIQGPFGGPFPHQINLPPTAQNEQIFVITHLAAGEPNPCARADFNADGTVDFFDYLDFVRALDAEDPAADINGDAIVDFFDYLDFADAFAQCG